LLDASSERVNHYEERRGNRKGDQGKSPIDVQHDSDHAEQSQRIDEHAEKRRVDKILDGTDIASDASNQVSRLCLVVFRQRKPLNMVVECPAKIVRYPLADARRQVFFDVRAGCSYHGDRYNGHDCKIQNWKLFVTKGVRDKSAQPVWQLLCLQDIVNDDFNRPGLENVREASSKFGPSPSQALP